MFANKLNRGNGRRLLLSPDRLLRRGLKAVIVILRTAFLIGLCYLFLFPIFYLVLSAITAPEALNDPSVVWLPNEIDFSSFRAAFEEIHFGESATLTAMNAVLGTAASLISCSMVGYGFARFKFFEKKFLFMIVILMVIVPPQTLLISQYLHFRFFDFGGILSILEPITGVGSISLLSSSWTFVFPALFAGGLRSGLFIFIFRQFFFGLPKDLEEAARIDGCGAMKTFARIIVPITVPAFVTVTLFSFVWHWNDYYMSDMMFNTEIKPLIPMLRIFQSSMNSFVANQPNRALEARGWLAAACLLTIMVPMVLYTVMQRFFVESVERTGLVG